MNKFFKIVGFGALVWAVTFVAGFFLYTPEGQPRLDEGLIFNIFMLLTLLVGLSLLVAYFKSLTGDYLREGVIIGVSWQLLHSLLDLAIIVPLFDMTIGFWWQQIGVGHFIFPMMAIAIGVIAENKSR